jgi:alkylhydroperoxidase family enzyme
MPHIALPEGLPGIRGAMAFRPETAKPLNELAEILLRGPGTLSPAERELIATYVSSSMIATTARAAMEPLPPRI